MKKLMMIVIMCCNTIQAADNSMPGHGNSMIPSVSHTVEIESHNVQDSRDDGNVDRPHGQSLCCLYGTIAFIAVALAVSALIIKS